ncbi:MULTISPECIES: hypothetical protein [Methylomonas]|uniref:hypothetical protein n=1 Tax=Methylomonas TaxID=416 RepID=UPI0009EE456C|nr:hypothetical protein [Methylomonas koyamae]
MSKKPCTHEYLANSETGKVLICRDCGVVHLNMQNMTLRFDAEKLAEIVAMMTTASKRLRHESVVTTRTRPALTLVH